MKLFVGLGNPGVAYEKTRHNAGFLCVDAIAKHNDISFEKNKYLHALVAQSSELVLMKPETFMNDSGRAVSALVREYPEDYKSLTVIHDDLDIPLGSYKIQFGIGPKEHNGITSIEESLKTNQFCRVRIGVDNRDPLARIPGEAYVLQEFSPDELKVLNETIEKVQVELFKTSDVTSK